MRSNLALTTNTGDAVSPLRGSGYGPDMPGVELVVPPSLGAQWAGRYERGEVPGRWPYGLEWLSTPRTRVSLREVAPPGAGRRLASRLGSPRRSDRPDGLAWDENLALRMVVCGRYRNMHCGVIWASDRWQQFGRRERHGLRRTLAQMRSVWVLSQAQLESVGAIIPAATSCHFVPFGIDEAFFTPAPYPERPLILSAGGDRDRDPQTTLEAFAQVVRARPATRAILQTSSNVGHAPGVSVVPHLSHVELRQHYRDASLIAVATRSNLHVSGMTVALEAQASARPILLSRTPGADDYVSDGEVGFLTGIGHAGELAEKIIALLDDPGWAARLGAQGRVAVEDRFTSRHLAARLRRVVGIE